MREVSAQKSNFQQVEKGRYFASHQVGLIQKKNCDIITREVNVENMGEKYTDH